MTPRVKIRKSLPRSIWALGFVSLFMDISSELVHSLLPVFMISTMGASVASLGLLEGLPLVMVVMSLVYALAAYPVGILSDRIDRRWLLIIGTGILILADLVLAYATNVGWVMLGVSLWGLHMGFSQGLLATLVADTTPEERRGTAFGLFNFISGLALLIASALAGFLWDLQGPQTTFLTGASFTTLALIGLLYTRIKGQNKGA